jgi:S1-C subfamily serine protease
MKRLAFLALSAAALLSCAGGPDRREPAPVPELSTSWMATVEQAMLQGRFGEAYQTVSYLERNPAPGVTAEELTEFKDRIAAGLADSFQDKVRRRDYSAALGRFHSLAALGREVPDWSQGRLLAALAAERSARGELPVAFLYALRALGAGERDAQFLSLALRLAAQLGNGPVYDEVAGLMQAAGLPLPADAPGKPAGLPPVGTMVRGTVTIWVNKGIKIEKGVGLPDRVIGSGFFIDPRGYLLTNYHVIESEVDPKYEGYSRLYVRPSDRVEARLPAKVVGYDRIFDLALVKAELTPEYVFSSAEDPELKVGNAILAIGSPAGLENTVTSGIVSATGRRFLQMGDAVQVDVPINYGNSGGPLLDSSGQLVGVVFAGIEQFEGVNFVIPYSWVNKALPGLYRGGEARHPWLGMAVQETGKGLEVLYALPGGPAAAAGLEAGDLLASLNGTEHRKLGPLQAALLELEPGALIALSWRRGSETLSGYLSLGERPFSPMEEALEKDRRERVLYPLFGMRLAKTGTFLWRDSFVVERVLAGSVADETGLSEGDPLVITAWKLNREERYAMVQIVVKKRKSGFLESAVQLAAYLETDNFV